MGRVAEGYVESRGEVWILGFGSQALGVRQEMEWKFFLKKTLELTTPLGGRRSMGMFFDGRGRLEGNKAAYGRRLIKDRRR